jgi:hypothetical protein
MEREGRAEPAGRKGDSVMRKGRVRSKRQNQETREKDLAEGRDDRIEEERVVGERE